MNQILSFENVETSKKQLNKIIIFFAIIIIIFALVLIAEGVLGYQKEKQKFANVEQPNIDISINGSTSILKFNSTVGIKRVIYYWDNGQKEQVEKNNEKNFEMEIEIPNLNGINNLNVEILDSVGNSIKYEPIAISYEDVPEEEIQEDFEIAVTKDKEEPKILLDSDNGKVIIRVTDNLKMSYITYSWNDGEEISVTGLSEDEKYLETEIDPLRGTNKLVIKAYDMAGNVATYEKKVHGTGGPEIDVHVENDEIVAKITDEYGITKIVYNFNNEETIIDNINQQTYELRLQLVDGENKLGIDAYENNVKKEYRGRTTK